MSEEEKVDDSPRDIGDVLNIADVLNIGDVLNM